MKEQPALTPFEAFVNKIASVPKEVVEQLEAQRIKRPKRKRRITAKKP